MTLCPRRASLLTLAEVFCVTISTIAFDSELPLTRQRAIGSRQTGRSELVVRTPTIVRDLPAAGPSGHRHR